MRALKAGLGAYDASKGNGRSSVPFHVYLSAESERMHRAEKQSAQNAQSGAASGAAGGAAGGAASGAADQ